MPIIRIAHRPRYTSIANAVLEDTALSFKARGLLAYLLSRPENWTIHINHLATLSPHEGKDAIRSALRELVTTGYATFDQPRAHGQFAEGGWIIYEQPQATLPRADKPHTVLPDTANPPLIKTEKKLKTEKKAKTKIPPYSPWGESIRFNDFWRVYPKRWKRERSLAVWRKLNLDPLADTIIRSVQEHLPYWEDPKFIPLPENFLAEKRWEDELTSIPLPQLSKAGMQTALGSQQVMADLAREREERARATTRGTTLLPNTRYDE